MAQNELSKEVVWKPEFRPCPICNSEKRKKLGFRGGRYQRAGKGVETEIVRCLNCTVLYTYPTLIPQSNPYETETAEEYFDLHDTEWKIRNGGNMAEFAEGILGAPGRMLEIGCGQGELLIGAAKRGWKVYGIEMTEHYAELARSNGIEIENSPVETSEFINREYDVILLAAILEHLYAPLEILKKVRNALRPGGLVFIDVPNESSFTMQMGNIFMKMRGQDAVINLNPTFYPYDVVGFSPESLEFTLKSVGFRVLKMEKPKWFNPIKKGENKMQDIKSFVFGSIQTVGAAIGKGDGIVCWAVKE